MIEERIKRRERLISKLNEAQRLDVKTLLGYDDKGLYNVSNNKIMSTVFKYYGVTPKEVFQLGEGGRMTRQRKYINARFAYFYFCRKFTDMTLKEIGYIKIEGLVTWVFDHSTVIHGCTSYQNSIDTEKRTRALADTIDKVLKCIC